MNTLSNIDPLLFTIAAAVFGLVFGSFINVVIYRLPLMLEQQWRSQCRELLDDSDSETDPDQDDDTETPDPSQDGPITFNLMSPPSSCPACNTPIKPWHNIPVLGWLILRGRCAACGAPISIQYPVVELLGGLLAGVVAYVFGPSTEAIAAMIFSWALLALSVIDLREQLLPDLITIPLMWGGLLLSLFGVFVEVHSALIGAIAGYLSLWIIYWIFRLATGKEGLGYGDFKIFAALGAWMGWQALPVVIVMSSVVGAVLGLSLLATGQQKRGQRMPFGPFLAAAGWITLLWSDQIIHYYYALFGIL